MIRPTLEEEGVWVLCDRFTDSSYAYQGGGRGIDKYDIGALERMVQGEVQDSQDRSQKVDYLRPDLVIYLDVWSRILGNKGEDRIEREGIAFLRRVRDAYRSMACASPGRYAVVSSEAAIDKVFADVATEIRERLL